MSQKQTPKHRRNRWIVGALIAPPLMAGFSYAYNLKTKNKLNRLIYAIVFAYLLNFMSMLVTGGFIDVLIPNVSEDIFFGYIFPFGLYLFSWIVIWHYWNKLPQDFKIYGW